MTPTTTAPVFSPTSRFLPLWTWDGRRQLVGKMHLARVKSTKHPVALAWCGRRYWVDPHGWKTVTGAFAAAKTGDDYQPTCALCLERVGAWEWDW